MMQRTTSQLDSPVVVCIGSLVSKSCPQGLAESQDRRQPVVGPGTNTMSLLDLLRDMVLATRSLLDTLPASAGALRFSLDSFLSKGAWQVWLCWPASTEAV